MRHGGSVACRWRVVDAPMARGEAPVTVHGTPLKGRDNSVTRQ